MKYSLPDAHRLNKFAGNIMTQQSLEDIIDTALAEIERTFGLPDSELWFFLEAPGRLRCHGTHGRIAELPRPAPIDTSTCGIWQTLYKTVRIGYFTDFDLFASPTRQRAESVGAVASLGIPLLSDDVWLGFINIWVTAEQHPVPDQLRALVDTAGKFIAMAMDNLRRKRLNRTFQLEVSAIQTVTETLSEPTSLDVVFNSILRAALALNDATDAHIFLYDGETLSFGAALWADGRTETPFNQPRPGGLTYQVAQRGKTIAINSIASHPLFANQKFNWDDDGAIIGIPLKIGDTVVGVMNVAFDEAHSFHPSEIEAFKVLAAQAAIAIANSQLFARAQMELKERRRAEAALTESEQRYRALVEHSADAIYLMVGGKYELINRRFEEMFGVTLAQLNDPNFDPINLFAPESHPILQAEIEKRRAGLPLKPSVELRARHINGHEFDVELSPTVFHYKGTQAVQGIIRDITERKRLDEQMRYAQRMESVGELAGGIAHNFNNILTAITALSSLALAEIPQDSTLHNDLSIIRNQADRAAALVKEMLYFSQRRELDIHPLDVNDLIANTGKFLNQFLGVSVTLQKELGKNLPLIHADVGALEQIIANIALNARDAMPHGGKLRIATDVVTFDGGNPPPVNVPAGRYVRLSLSDTGIGISEDNLPRIFDPFFTTKEPNYNSGLGLAMVFGLMNQFDGFIQTKSKENEGTTINLYFPALPDDARSASHTPHPPKPLAGGSERILLLEIDDLTRRVIKRILENVGYVVFTATTGHEAIEVLKNALPPIEIIISSTKLPDMTGLKFFTDVVAAKLQTVPTFIFSTTEAAEAPETYLSPELAAQYPVLKKPYSPIMLTETIRKLLELN